MPRNRDKYALYERSVQSPEHHTEWFVSVYKELRDKYPVHLREDFCGTFRLSCEWVKRNRRNTALGVDLDPEPLAYGKRTHVPELTKEQKGRLRVLNTNVLAITDPKVDVILACNFSFNVFKERATLVRYLRGCLRSLRKDGVVVLDLAGGPGMIERIKERKRKSDKKLGKWTYIWDQQSYDPITHDARYGITFQFPDGSQMKDAFSYDWRLWTIPEVREALAEAGFPKSCVYWETEHKGEGTGEYLRAEKGDNAYAWVAYVVGMK